MHENTFIIPYLGAIEGVVREENDHSFSAKRVHVAEDKGRGPGRSLRRRMGVGSVGCWGKIVNNMWREGGEKQFGVKYRQTEFVYDY